MPIGSSTIISGNLKVKIFPKMNGTIGAPYSATVANGDVQPVALPGLAGKSPGLNGVSDSRNYRSRKRASPDRRPQKRA